MKRKYLGILTLASNHTLKPTLLLCSMMIIIQGITFLLLGQNQIDNPQYLYIWIESPTVKYSFLIAITILGYLVVERIIGNVKSMYTIHRLSSRYRMIAVCLLINTIFMVMILWFVQTLILILASYYYVQVSPDTMISMQTIYVSNMQSDFFHFIIPLNDPAMFIRNILGLGWLCLGTTLITMRKWNGESIKMVAGFVYPLFWIFFSTPSSNSTSTAMLFGLGVVILMFTIYRLGGKKNET